MLLVAVNVSRVAKLQQNSTAKQDKSVNASVVKEYTQKKMQKQFWGSFEREISLIKTNMINFFQYTAMSEKLLVLLVSGVTAPFIVF